MTKQSKATKTTNEAVIQVRVSSGKGITQPREGDAGYDLYASEAVTLRNMTVVPIKTGVFIEIPAGYVGLIQDRSSMGANYIKVFGGVIDSSYRGEVMVMLGNFGSDKEIPDGAKIAQMVIVPHRSYPLVMTSDLTETERGEQGFGSTGA